MLLKILKIGIEGLENFNIYFFTASLLKIKKEYFLIINDLDYLKNSFFFSYIISKYRGYELIVLKRIENYKLYKLLKTNMNYKKILNQFIDLTFSNLEFTLSAFF